MNWQFYHVRCKTIETSIFNVNGDSLQSPLIYRDFRETAPLECGISNTPNSHTKAAITLMILSAPANWCNIPKFKPNKKRTRAVNLCFNLHCKCSLKFWLLTEWLAAAVLDESKCRGNHSLKSKRFDQSRSPITLSVGHSVRESLGEKVNKEQERANKARKGRKFITRLAIKLFKLQRKEKNDSEMCRWAFLRETRLKLNNIKQTFIML